MFTIENESMKQMLSTLLETGTMSMSDIASALYERKEQKQMKDSIIKIPKIGYREDREKYYITVPKRLSKTSSRYPVYGDTEEEVIENYKLEISLNNKGVSVGEESITPTFVNMLEYTMRNILYFSLNKTSYLSYESLCKNHILNKPFAKKKIDEITFKELNKYFNSEISKMTVAAIGSIYSIMNKTYEQAIILGHLTKNPMDLINISFSECKKPEKKKQRLSHEEFERLCKAVPTLCQFVSKYRYTPMYIIACYTGLRLGELIGVKKTDIDLQVRVLHLRRQLVYLPDRDVHLKRGKFRLVEQEPKYDSERDIPLSKQAIFWIELTIEMNKQDGFDSEYIFLNKLGRVPSRASVNDIWHQLLEELDIPYCTPHKLRKTFTTFLLDSGNIELPEVSSILGHKHKTMTLDTYFTAINDNTFSPDMPNRFDNIFDNTVTTGASAEKLRKYY